MTQNLLSRSINPKQVNMSEYLRLDGWDTQNEIGLIEWLCGWGKTYLATSTAANSLLSKVNEAFNLDIQPYQVLFLVSRAAIREQLLDSKKNVNAANLREVRSIEDLSNCGFVDEPHKIRICTYHKFGDEIEGGKNLPDSVRLVICDEFHSVFADTFSSQMFAVKKWLASTPIIRIGLTATPQPLEYLTESRHWTQEKCIEQYGFKFRDIACGTEPKYRFNHFSVISSGMSVETAFREFRGSEDSKSIFFTFSARTATKLKGSSNDSLLFISQGNEKKDKEGSYLIDYMDIDRNEELLRSGLMPHSYNNVIATSCFREGVDLRDSSVKNVVVQSYLPHEIIQSLGRFRNDIENVYILANRASHEMFYKECSSALAFLDMCGDIDNQELLEMKYKEQQQSAASNLPVHWLVNQWNGKYEVDYSILAYWLYVEDSWLAASNYNGKYISYLGRELETRKEFYRNMFEIYTDSPINYLLWDKTKTRLSLIEDRFNNIDEIVEPYLNVPLYVKSEERQALVDAIGAVDESGHKKKWTTVKKWLKAKGYKILDCRDNEKKSYSIISKH